MLWMVSTALALKLGVTGEGKMWPLWCCRPSFCLPQALGVQDTAEHSWLPCDSGGRVHRHCKKLPVLDTLCVHHKNLPLLEPVVLAVLPVCRFMAGAESPKVVWPSGPALGKDWLPFAF